MMLNKKDSNYNPYSVSDTDVIGHTPSIDESFETNLVSLLHNNINVSNFETSKAFYQLLGFVGLLEVNVSVSNPDEAQAFNLIPYKLKATPMILPTDSFLVDLIQYTSPFYNEAPHNDVYSLGLSTLSLKTDDLASDMAVLEASNIAYTIVDGTKSKPNKIRLADPDGTIILLTEVFENKGMNSSGQTYVHGLFSTNINVSNLDIAIEFYSKVGFKINEKADSATIEMLDGRHITLTQSSSKDLPYGEANHLGIARIAIVTTDIDDDIRRLHSSGIKTFTPNAITPTNELAIFRYIAFEDPDGTIIQLVEYFE